MSDKAIEEIFPVSRSWGMMGSIDQTRYAEPIENVRRARKCLCGCGRRSRFRKMANGVSLGSGCEMAVNEWVADPITHYRKSKDRRTEADAVRNEAEERKTLARLKAKYESAK